MNKMSLLSFTACIIACQCFPSCSESVIMQYVLWFLPSIFVAVALPIALFNGFVVPFGSWLVGFSSSLFE